MAKGILWVSSRITQSTRLSPEKFCDWYENQHIQEVLSLSGIPSATRYHALDPQPSPETWSSNAPWLTVYEMPDLEFRQSAEFKGLDGQSMPSEELLKGIFENARFDTRFYREVQVYTNPNSPTIEQQTENGTTTQVKFLISAALEPPPSSEAANDFDTWYREEHLEFLARAPEYVRTRRYEVVEGNTLDGFVRREPEEGIPRFLALHEFVGGNLPWKVLGESAGTEWAERVMGGLVKSEIGWYVVRREYGEEERERVGV